MVQITNEFDRAMSLLASQFRGQKANGELTNLQKLIKILCVPAQELEDVNWQLKTQRWLDVAVGYQLDELGIILGVARQIGESDEDYRERLQFQIFINTSNGTPEDSIKVLAFLTQGTNIGYHELRPAAYQMETNGLKFPDPPNELNDGLFSVSPAGVNYVPIVATYNVPISFELSGDLSLDPLWVAPDSSDYTILTNLEVEPYNKIIYVSAGNVEDTGPNGGLDELNFPLPTAGQLSELIQKGGNFPARRFY
jgi:hypothetical protein